MENEAKPLVTDADRESMRQIWSAMRHLCGDYSEVPFDHILVRPRYAHLVDPLRTAARVRADRERELVRQRDELETMLRRMLIDADHPETEARAILAKYEASHE